MGFEYYSQPVHIVASGKKNAHRLVSAIFSSSACCLEKIVAWRGSILILRDPNRSRAIEIHVPITVVSTALAALIAGAAFGGVLHATGLVGAVAALYGVDGLVDGRIVILVHSLIGSAVFVAALERAVRSRYAPLPVTETIRRPILGACVGAACGVVLWLLVVAVGVPLLADVVAGGHLPFPYRHGPSLLALGWFGTVLGAWYPLRYETFDPTE